MCPSKPSKARPLPIRPPGADPAEFLNEELQQSTASRRILGIRRLQAGFQEAGGSGGAAGARGGTEGVAGLSTARSIAATASKFSSIKSVKGFMTQDHTRTRQMTRAEIASSGGGMFQRRGGGTRTITEDIAGGEFSTTRPRQDNGRRRIGAFGSGQGTLIPSVPFTGSQVTTRDGVTTFRAGRKKAGGKK